MNTFEDDAINDDFEIEITDLPTNDEENRVSNAIAALRSRISLSLHSEESDNEVANDDLAVEITDLPRSDDTTHRGRFIAPMTSAQRSGAQNQRSEVERKTSAAKRSVYQSFLPSFLPSVRAFASIVDVARRRPVTNPSSLHSRLPRKTHLVRQAIVGIAVLFMLAVVLESVPSSRSALLGLFPRPTPTPTPAIATREFGRFGSFYSGAIIIAGDISISSTPIAGVPVIPSDPHTPIADMLGPAPQTCPYANVPQDPDSIDSPYGNRIGGPPLWVMGFLQGAPAQLIGFVRANPPQYGWVRQVTLMLEGGASGPVMLQGAGLQDGTPLLFRDPYSDQNPTTFLTVNPGISSVSNPDGALIGGIAPISLYIPATGCYYLKASWAGGSWEAIFAAGQ